MKVTAKATRTGAWWAVEVPEVDGLFTQAKRLDHVPAMVRDAVALLEDVPEESVEVEIEVEIDEVYETTLDVARADRAESERLARKASDSIAELARAMTEEDQLSLRDVGVILGMSHQRVAQILKASSPPGASVPRA